MNIKKVSPVSKYELSNRMERFISEMSITYPEWEMCIVVGSVNMYYFTGTICDGILLIQRSKDAVLWVRRSYERALIESEFKNIKPMSGFREIADTIEKLPDTLYLDMSCASLEWYGFLSKYMKFDKMLPVDNVLSKTRSIKSEYEINIMKETGKTIDRLLNDELPAFFKTGMSEAELGADIFSLFIKNNYHGVSRFSMKNTDVVLGHIGFAKSPLYPSIFNGASGLTGICPAAPVLGSRDVKLKEGDLIYIDVGFGIEGYHVDKTLIYSYKRLQSDEVNTAHEHCLELERKAVSLLRIGAIPSEIYKKVYESVKPEFRDCFMGVRSVPFLGHGVGLYVDEYPVIANKFDEPLKYGMTIAIEPKIALKNTGMVGSENTYLITNDGAVSLTGKMRELVLVN